MSTNQILLQEKMEFIQLMDMSIHAFMSVFEAHMLSTLYSHVFGAKEKRAYLFLFFV